jgi:hypothetical protein
MTQQESYKKKKKSSEGRSPSLKLTSSLWVLCLSKSRVYCRRLCPTVPVANSIIPLPFLARILQEKARWAYCPYLLASP